MISRIVVRSYRCFRALDVEPHDGMNVLCGANESGKSTLLEAIALALTGKVNGRWASEELNPFWFHRQTVLDFFKHYGTDDAKSAPKISIELYFRNDVDALQGLRGVHNSQRTDCPGVALRVRPSDDFQTEF